MDKVLDWIPYFMEIAKTVSIRSKDPNTKVGAVITNKNNQIVGTGYNGFPPGVEETDILWQRPFKYSHVIHSEVNAIINSSIDLNDCILYSTLCPCSDCVKAILSNKIEKVYYLDNGEIKLFNLGGA